jgi:hypothetical protein
MHMYRFYFCQTNNIMKQKQQQLVFCPPNNMKQQQQQLMICYNLLCTSFKLLHAMVVQCIELLARHMPKANCGTLWNICPSPNGAGISHIYMYGVLAQYRNPLCNAIRQRQMQVQRDTELNHSIASSNDSKANQTVQIDT